MIKTIAIFSSFLLFFFTHQAFAELELTGKLEQGGLIVGHDKFAQQVLLDGKSISISPYGSFVFGFGRDAKLEHQLVIVQDDGNKVTRNLQINKRNYKIQKIKGISKKIMNPNPKAVKRSKKDNTQVKTARSTRSNLPYFASQFTKPSEGVITGVYGSQRVFNGIPKRPHFGLDYAGKIGSPVKAPASGRVTLWVPDMFYSGGTLIIDHGYGINSTFLHLSKSLVKAGDIVKQGQIIAEIGKSGRATGPHLDWRVNWFQTRLDPELVLLSKTPIQ